MHQQRSNELTVQWLRTLMRLSHDPCMQHAS